MVWYSKRNCNSHSCDTGHYIFIHKNREEKCFRDLIFNLHCWLRFKMVWLSPGNALVDFSSDTAAVVWDWRAVHTYDVDDS